MKETKFKQTEVGMIPSDWEVKTISEIAESVGDGIHSTPAYSGLGTVFFINGNNIKDGKLILHNDTKKVDESVARKYSFPISKRTLLMSINGTIGNIAPYNNEPVILGKSAAYISVRRNYNRFFLMYMLQMDYVKQFFENSLTGSTIKNLGLSTIRETYIKIPPTIEEQQRIANALSDVDTLIANLEKLIAKKKNIKQGAMQQLLTGKKRLPGFGSDERRKECHSERSAKHEVEDSNGNKMTELGMIPSDWELKTFGELFDILPNNTLSRAELNENSGSFKNIHYGDVLVKFQEWIDCSKNTLPFINSNAKFNRATLQDGDVIIADTAEDETVGKSTEIYNVGKLKIVSGLHTIPIRPKKKFASKWLGYFINSACWHDQILPFITGTKVSAISKAAVAETKFFYPAKIEEQNAIANVLSDMDTEIATLETKLAKYRKLKTGMMQQLLTGKVRLV